MEKEIESLIVKFEEYFNRKSTEDRRAQAASGLGYVSHDDGISMLSERKKREIDTYVDDIVKPQTQPDYVCSKMLEKGFVYSDGQLNFVKFYTHARINPDVWHTFINQKHRPSEDTMFKIIFALALNEEEARSFLGLGGTAFNQADRLHRYVLACINTDTYDPDDVYEVLDFYGVHNIYAEKKARKDCK